MALWEFDSHRILSAFLQIIVFQFATKLAGENSHCRVLLRIVVGRLVERFDPDSVLFEFLSRSVKQFLCYQECAPWCARFSSCPDVSC